MDDTSYEELLDRLGADPSLEPGLVDLITTAAEGPEALAAHLDGAPAPDKRDTGPASLAVPARVYLTEIAVTGFRGVADRARIPFEAGPGLTLITGRNGSGKSSFAEGLELLLTGRNLRWDGKPKAWKDGWRNLHADAGTSIEARFQLDGETEPLRVSKSWRKDARLEDGGDERDVEGAATDWDDLGWGELLERYRPILSYNEMGAMFSERAADLYAALSAVLGLEPFDALQATLRDARLGRGRSAKEEKATRAALVPALDASDDPRAAAVAEQAGKRTPDLDAVQAVLTGETDPDDSELAGLQQTTRLAIPATDEIAAAYANAEDAHAQLGTLEAGSAERDISLAELLEQTIAFHAAHGAADHDTCPVCRTPGALAGDWAKTATRQARDLRKASSELQAARAAATQAMRGIEALFPPATPITLARAPVKADKAIAAWEAWAQDRTRANATTLRKELTKVRDRATADLAAREDVWKPVQDKIIAWLAAAHAAERDRTLVKQLSAAEDWMKNTTAALRADRLKPIVDSAQANWNELRHESNVAVGHVELRKSGNLKSVVFDVTVDGAEASAFGVMSQGELSALAISVFLPRASLPDSPFGFMVIDDPVQSMDPAKVDGLARVLAKAAESRQVIVFTHDERLPQAVERLAIPARVVNVKRRAKSKVEVVLGSAPSRRYIDEAIALCKTDDLADDIRARVVPVFCRSAIEAACATRIRRRRFGAGQSHAEVERVLGELTSTTTWLADAFGLKTNQGEAIRKEVRRLGGAEAVKVVELAKAGAHGPLRDVDALDLARGAERLVKNLEAE